MEGIYRKKGGVRELLLKEKNGLFGGWDVFSLGEEKRRVFIMQKASSFYEGWRGPI